MRPGPRAKLGRWHFPLATVAPMAAGDFTPGPGGPEGPTSTPLGVERAEPSGAVEATGATASSPRRRPRPLLVAVLVVAIAGCGWLAWARTRPPIARFCTLTGAIDTPSASTPEAAFDAWWSAGGPAQARSWTLVGPVSTVDRLPVRADFVQISDTTWEWRYLDDRSVGVDVGPDPSGGYQVVGVNGCGYGPLGGR